MNQVNEKLKQSCEEAIVAIQKLNDETYAELQSKLEWCIGSYEHDKNPAGLYEYGVQSLDALKTAKEAQPRKVTKKVIDGLEKAIKNFSQN
ncbi:MAG: hypothetical protein KQI35_13510 [Bacteroidetes bacterium]|nr:hypothetical protein [Bacteroidota bacterium]